MSDSKLIHETPPDDSVEASQSNKPRLLDDPVVRVMVYVSVGIVILYLVAALSVLTTRVTQPTGPRTLAERELIVAAAGLGPQTKGEAWTPYITAMIATGDTARAGIALQQARASVSGTMPVSDLDLAEARLLRAKGDNEKSVLMADKAMKGYVAENEARIAAGGKVATAAKTAGYGENYYNAALVKAHALTEMERWKESVEVFDIYLLHDPAASDIFVDRGNAKASLNDKPGAEKDFREALRFVPDDEQAQAGLKRIGAAQ